MNTMPTVVFLLSCLITVKAGKALYDFLYFCDHVLGAEAKNS